MTMPIAGSIRLALAAGLFAGSLTSTASAADVKVAPYGSTKDGRAVTAYTLVNDRGASVTLLDYGATVAAIRVPDRDGKIGNIAYSFAGMDGWEASGHANAVVGRVANRIINGFTLDGVRYPLKPGRGGVTMHSADGYTGYSMRVWTVDPLTRRDTISMTLDSPDGDQGMPGHVKVRVTYRFTNDNALRLDFTATTDKATPVNLTNHLYFNLQGNSVGPVFDHRLQVNADQIAGEPDVGVEGQLRPVAGTPFDFTRPTPLKERMAMALGPQYLPGPRAPGSPPPPAPPPTVIRNVNLPFFAKNGLDRVAATLSEPTTGRVVEVRTTEPSAHIYVLPRARGEGVTSDVGKPFTVAPAIAIEAQHLPDSINFPQYPSTVLRPGQTFHSTTIFTFKTDAKR
jgi:aldose 1-epimerase